MIQSRELNIEKYIQSLAEKAKEQTNELLKMQTTEYMQYIGELVSMSRIMNKRFYITIPYNPMSDKQKGFFSRFIDVFRPATLIRMKDDKFKRRRIELTRRVGNIMSGLGSVGLNAVELDTQGLIELYYNSYNLSTSSNQKLVDVNQLRVKKQ